MTQKVRIISGNHHDDIRGEVSFVNDFDMAQVKRFYRIRHFDTKTVRGWRAHKIEQRWFHVFSGSFIVNLVKIDNWDKPSPNVKQNKFILKATDISVLHIPVGYASSLQAVDENSEMIVFADYPIENAKYDDYLYPSDFFTDY
jgi:dTDP-4-dehydrorhamnose 3,5-epimerase-like enzyme